MAPILYDPCFQFVVLIAVALLVYHWVFPDAKIETPEQPALPRPPDRLWSMSTHDFRSGS